MDKLISVGSHDPLGNPRFHLIYPRESMAKMASSDRDGAMDLSIMPDELARFWRDYDPDFDSYAFAHINIVSAFGYYGPNNNGDGFKEEHIYGDGYYRTFESGHPFLLHNNKDPKYSIGKVIATGYNLKMHRIEVITRLDKKNTKSIEIIARIRSGRFPDVSMGCRVPFDVCLPANTIIRTSDGYKQVNTIVKGNKKVRTHTGGNHEVTQTMCRMAPEGLVKIMAIGVPPISATPNHPFLTLSRDIVRSCSGSANGNRLRHAPTDNGCSRCGNPLDWQPEWKAAEDVRPGDYLMTPVDHECIDSNMGAMARLLGYYLGDGYIIKQRAGKKKDGSYKDMGVGFSVGSTEEEHLARLLDTLTKCNTANDARIYDAGCDRKALIVNVYDQGLAKELMRLGGRTSEGKYLHEDVFIWSTKDKQQLLCGYIDTDGSCDEKGNVRISTINRGLALDMQRIAHSLGIPASVTHSGDTGIGTYSQVVKQIWSLYIPSSHAKELSEHSVKIPATIKTQWSASQTFFWNNYWCTPVRAIEVIEEATEVFNIAVDQDESYIAEGIAVHNCSICGKKARTREEYCDHAANHMLQYYPYDDMTNRGLITCVFNTKPTFFDQSFVFTRADKGTFVIQELNKAAGLIGTRYHFIGHSVDAGSRFFKEAERKKAEMEKTSPDDITRNVKVVDKEKYISDGNSNAVMPEFPLSTCKALSKQAMEDVFDTAGLMGIHIMPKEYAVIKAYRENDAPKAEVIKRHVRVMIAPKTASVTQLPIRAPRYSYEVARVLKPFMASRSFLPRFDNTRAKGASLTKEAAQLPCVSHEYTRQVLSTFESIRSWEGEFYKNASLVVAGQSDIHEFVNGNETKTDPKVAASRVGGAYMAFFGLRPSEK